MQVAVPPAEPGAGELGQRRDKFDRSATTSPRDGGAQVCSVIAGPGSEALEHYQLLGSREIARHDAIGSGAFSSLRGDLGDLSLPRILPFGPFGRLSAVQNTISRGESVIFGYK
jgi:hypothetical protein